MFAEPSTFVSLPVPLPLLPPPVTLTPTFLNFILCINRNPISLWKLHYTVAPVEANKKKSGRLWVAARRLVLIHLLPLALTCYISMPSPACHTLCTRNYWERRVIACCMQLAIAELPELPSHFQTQILVFYMFCCFHLLEHEFCFWVAATAEGFIVVHIYAINDSNRQLIGL